MNNIKPKTFVGILIMTNVYTHEKTSEKELVAILQRRGKVSDEDNTSFKWERYSGFCEVTSYGKMEANETIEETLMREVSEELGSKVAKMIKKYDKKILFEKIMGLPSCLIKMPNNLQKEMDRHEYCRT